MAAIAGIGSVTAVARKSALPVVDCYCPVAGTWRPQISGAGNTTRPSSGSRLGVVDMGGPAYGTNYAFATVHGLPGVTIYR